MTVINILNGMGIEFWIDGGWGVDILAGKIPENTGILI